MSRLTATALSLLRRTFSTATVDASILPDLLTLARSLSHIWASLCRLFLFRYFSLFFHPRFWKSSLVESCSLSRLCLK
ncbi:hypothetical protein C8R42DRAFT_678122 [Lentinula raphanica]|nr:hypothetical protein C8R42DRAFT_678122 [Lentinula raphanica]